jgi:hypothetical protein
MQQLAGLVKENQEEIYVPYQFDDERGKELYVKYEKAYENPSWECIDCPYEKKIELDKLLQITGMTLDELEELNLYRDESWSLNINPETNTVFEFND